MIIDRFFILLLVALAVVAGWGLVRLWAAHSVRRMQAGAPFAGMLPAGVPAVVAFSSPTCRECRTLQEPALNRLSASFGKQLAILQLSAPEHPELVEAAGILTVPATLVLDQRGAVRHLNLGFADTQRLSDQIRSVQN